MATKKQTICECCEKPRRDIKPFGEVGACFICRTEWTRRRRVYDVKLHAYVREDYYDRRYVFE